MGSVKWEVWSGRCGVGERWGVWSGRCGVGGEGGEKWGDHLGRSGMLLDPPNTLVSILNLTTPTCTDAL